MNIVKYAVAIAICLLFITCSEDKIDTTNDNYNIAIGSIIKDDYTAEGTLSFLFSTDDGNTWDSTPPKINNGSTFKVKVNNGTDDLETDYFNFDWNTSNPKPTNVTDAIAEFEVTSLTTTVSVTIQEIIQLGMVKKNTGELYILNDTEDLEFVFETTLAGGSDLNNLQSFIYHPETGTYFTGDIAGELYEVNPTTGVATIPINYTDHTDWNFLSSLTIAIDGNLIGKAITEMVVFDTSGNDIQLITLNGFVNCMIYDTDYNLIGTNGGFRNIDIMGDMATVQSPLSLVEGDNFPETIYLHPISIQSMTYHNGNYYGLLYDGTVDDQYLIIIEDFTTGVVHYVKTVLEDETINNNLYTGLTTIPKHKLPN